MKVNEAPERIYINSNFEKRTWLIGKGDSSFIEYVRTDAFIEKAERYIRSVADGLDKDDDVEAFISGFRKYMKGDKV